MSIGDRILFSAVGLAMAVALALGAISFGVVRHLIIQSITVGLDNQAVLIGQRMQSVLESFVADVTALSRNSFVANGLVDSQGRDTYLLPFLREHRMPAQGDVVLTLCDFKGVPLASSTAVGEALPPGIGGVALALSASHPVAEIVGLERDTLLVLSVPVIFPPTGQAEGVLVGRVRLRDIFNAELSPPTEDYQLDLLVGGQSISAASTRPAGTARVRVERRLQLPPPLAAIPFTVEVGRTGAAALLGRVALAYLAVGLLMLLAVFPLARTATRRLLSPLDSLSRTAGEIAASGSLQLSAEVTGEDEVGRLAASFNTMLARLRESAQGLERRVEERTEELSRANEELRAGEARTRLQRDLSTLLGSTSDLREALRHLLDALCGYEGIDGGGVYLVDAASGDFELAAHRGLSLSFVAAVSHLEAGSPSVRRALAGEPIYRAFDAHGDLQMRLEGVRALAAVPILHEQRVIACLNLASHTSEAITPETRTMIETVAAQIGGTIARLRAEDALAQSRQNLQALFDTIDDFLFIIDAGDGRLLKVNPAVCERLGYDDAELAAMTVLDMHPPARRGEAAAIVAEMSAGSRAACPVPLLAKDGREIPVETRVTLGRWGGREVLFGISRDVTERRRMEEALRQKSEELERFFDVTLDMLCIADTTGRFRHLNRAWELTLGFTREELLGVTFFSLVHPDDQAATAAAVGKLSAQEPVFNFVNRYRCRDGGYRWIEWRSAPAGELIYAAARDITARIETEERLAEMNRTLEERVERETQLRLEKERMLVQQSRLAAMGEMIGAIAHQWRQPLNSVAAIVQDLADAQVHGELDAAYLARASGRAMQQVRFMSRTIDDFRNFFRPDKQKQPFDVKQAAAEVLGMLASQLSAYGITTRLICRVHGRVFLGPDSDVIPCGQMRIVGHENEIKQVILNLVANAKDAILERRASATGTAPEGGIDLEFDQLPGGRVEILVTDNGGGIPPQVVDRVFDPYFTTKDQGRGTGIGLYMAKMIIEGSMGGRLTARNVEGGAQFRVEIPGGNADA